MTITFDQGDLRKVLAEIVGTFVFFFIGIGSIVAFRSIEASSGSDLIIVALAHGVALAVAVSALGHVSGAHFNPAVTIVLLVTRKISPLLSLLYILGQLIGGVLSCLALVLIVPASLWQPVRLGTPGVSGIGIAEAIFLEAILTFFLVLAIFGTVVDPRAVRIGGFGIGLAVFVDILVGGPFTGAAMNPARAFAPALVSGAWGADHFVYWIGPILGAVIAALLYMAVFMPRGDEPVVVAPTITAQPLEPPVSEPGLLKDQ